MIVLRMENSDYFIIEYQIRKWGYHIVIIRSFIVNNSEDK